MLLMYTYEEDVPVNQEEIFKRISQEEIFKLVFDDVILNRYLTSPLREDANGGAWFNWWGDKLYFYDFADSERNIRDCFGVLMTHYNMTFRESMNYVNEHFELGLGGEKAVAPILNLRVNSPIISNAKRDIYFKSSKTFTKFHRNYFKSYGISKANLVEDNIFGVDRFKFYSEKAGGWVRIQPNPKEACYSINWWDDAKKICRAKYKGIGRFITNCTNDHIGGHTFAGDTLIITKSWKDYRVLKNAGLSAIWLQNEGQIPEINKLMAAVMTYNKVIVWFDNDETGIKAGMKLCNIINAQCPGKAIQYYLSILLLKEHKVKDPSDLKKHSEDQFTITINKFKHEIQSSINVA